MPRYAKICQDMPRYAVARSLRSSRDMPRYAKICQDMPRQDMPRYAKIRYRVGISIRQLSARIPGWMSSVPTTHDQQYALGIDTVCDRHPYRIVADRRMVMVGRNHRNRRNRRPRLTAPAVPREVKRGAAAAADRGAGFVTERTLSSVRFLKRFRSTMPPTRYTSLLDSSVSCAQRTGA